MNKNEAIQRGRALEAHIGGMDSYSGDAKTIHALLAHISMLESEIEKLLVWDKKYPESFTAMENLVTAENELDDIISDLGCLIKGRTIGPLEDHYPI